MERDGKIVEEIVAGATLDVVATNYSVSKERIRQIVKRDLPEFDLRARMRKGEWASCVCGILFWKPPSSNQDFCSSTCARKTAAQKHSLYWKNTQSRWRCEQAYRLRGKSNNWRDIASELEYKNASIACSSAKRAADHNNWKWPPEGMDRHHKIPSSGEIQNVA